jgi:hypothetical protein
MMGLVWFRLGSVRVRCEDSGVYKCTSGQVYKCTSVQVYKYNLTLSCIS